MFSSASIMPVLAALMMASYGLMTRFAARNDPAQTSFFWTGTIGAIVMSAVGIWFWQPMVQTYWLWMAALCITGVLGHWLLIKCYEVAEANAVQPFAYLQLVFASSIGILVFADSLDPMLFIGGGIIVSSGLFALQRERKVKSP